MVNFKVHSFIDNFSILQQALAFLKIYLDWFMAE